MKLIRTGSQHKHVLLLKRLLSECGYPLDLDDCFNEQTDQQVKQFQADNLLSADGVVGQKTWTVLLKKGYTFGIGTSNFFLDDNEWFPEYMIKDSIYLHHTAGNYRPDSTIGWWEKDNKPGKLMRVGTSFVIGRKSIDGDLTYDGKTYRAFKEIFWAHHLGTKLANNKTLNQKSIGIEICALGPVHKIDENTFEFRSEHSKIQMPRSEVCELAQPWRGHHYFQKYTTAQIDECERLILTMAYIFDIPIPNQQYDQSWFELNAQAQAGQPGLWTHAHVRSDKSDCFPQPEFIDMLNGLYQKSQTFNPDLTTLESTINFAPKDMKLEDVEYYSSDLSFEL